MDGTHRTKKRAAAILLGFFAAAAIAMPSAQAADRTVSELIPVGQTVGVKLFSDGVLVVGFSDGESPAKDCGLKEGDVITAICGQSLDTIEEFRQLLTENGEELQIEDLEIFENVAYVMAYHADNSIPAKIEDWLDQFDMFSIYEVLPQILELWGENLVTDVTSKKRLAEVSGK